MTDCLGARPQPPARDLDRTSRIEAVITAQAQIGTSQAEPIWTEFLRKLTRRGLRGVKLDVVGIFPNDDAIVRLVGALLRAWHAA